MASRMLTVFPVNTRTTGIIESPALTPASAPPSTLTAATAVP